MVRMALVFFFTGLLNSTKALSQLRLAPKPDSAKGVINIRPMPLNFYKTPTAFFCKKEVQLQKLTRLPIYIRLGSKEQADYLEGKGRKISKKE
jgi:hypothetical protein